LTAARWHSLLAAIGYKSIDRIPKQLQNFNLHMGRGSNGSQMAEDTIQAE
jgi:hypothetical protein